MRLLLAIDCTLHSSVLSLPFCCVCSAGPSKYPLHPVTFTRCEPSDSYFLVCSKSKIKLKKVLCVLPSVQSKNRFSTLPIIIMLCSTLKKLHDDHHPSIVADVDTGTCCFVNIKEGRSSSCVIMRRISEEKFCRRR